MGSQKKSVRFFGKIDIDSNPMKIKVKREGLHFNYFADIYHYVLSITWTEFFLVNTSLYILMNLFYASLYFVGGDSIINAVPGSFWDAFVFSFQTSTTIGYGHLQPANHYADAVVIFDALSGILFVAITTGLAFAKFSKPTARVLFTDNCVIQTYHGQKTLMFRVANARESHIADASMDVVAIMKDVSPEGIEMQRLQDLKLVRHKTPMFFISWSVMHVIDEDSPLHSLSAEDFEAKNVRLVVSLTGIDDWSAQLVHTNHIYRASDIAVNRKFADILETLEDGTVVMDYHYFNELIPVNE